MMRRIRTQNGEVILVGETVILIPASDETKALRLTLAEVQAAQKAGPRHWWRRRPQWIDRAGFVHVKQGKTELQFRPGTLRELEQLLLETNHER